MYSFEIREVVEKRIYNINSVEVGIKTLNLLYGRDWCHRYLIDGKLIRCVPRLYRPKKYNKNYLSSDAGRKYRVCKPRRPRFMII